MLLLFYIVWWVLSTPFSVASCLVLFLPTVVNLYRLGHAGSLQWFCSLSSVLRPKDAWLRAH